MQSTVNTHYSKCLNPALLSLWASTSAQQIEERLQPGEVPVLCYRGMSGTGSATALSLALHYIGVQHGMIYVRKDAEMKDCHGGRVERALPALGMADQPILVFVDDFIGTGRTRYLVLTAAADAVPANMSEDCLVALSGKSEGDGYQVQRVAGCPLRRLLIRRRA